MNECGQLFISWHKVAHDQTVLGHAVVRAGVAVDGSSFCTCPHSVACFVARRLRADPDHVHASGRMVITEVEYIFSVCRSMIDLFQEIAAELWNKIKLYGEALPEQKKLKKSFNEMIWFHGRLTTADELRTRFGILHATRGLLSAC
ncbi:hypothetical protein D3C73_1200730 [compost metagenome]